MAVASPYTRCVNEIQFCIATPWSISKLHTLKGYRHTPDSLSRAKALAVQLRLTIMQRKVKVQILILGSYIKMLKP